MKLLPLVVAGLLLGNLCNAQVPDASLTRAQAAADARTMIDLLEATHPDPYTAFGGKVAFASAAQELQAALPQNGLTRSDLATRLNAFMVRLHDGHSYIDGMQERWRDPAPRLPVRFGIATDGLFIAAHDLPVLDGTVGWRVLAVEGVPVDTLAARFDGHPTENRYGGYTAIAPLLGSRRLAHNLLGDAVGSDGALTLTLEAPDGRTGQRVLPWSAASTTAAESWRSPPAQWPAAPHVDAIVGSALLDSPAAGYLRIRSLMTREAFEIAWRMNPENAKQQAERFFRSSGRVPPADLQGAIAEMPSLFETTAALLHTMQSRRTGALIIDLRDNGGGYTESAYPLLHALYGDAFYGTPWPGEYVRRESELYLKKRGQDTAERRRLEPAFEVGRYTFSRDTAGNAEQVRRARMAQYAEAGYSFAPALAQLGGAPLHRPERIIVLCNQGTYSAAFHLLVWLRSLGATTVGVPPRQSPNAFMDVTPFTLPASGITGSISNSVQYMLPQEPRALTLPPDFPVTVETFRRFGGAADAPLRFALELLESGRIPAR